MITFDTDVAICVAHNAKLITRNRRDFERIPGLIVEFWD
jgi:predicted nucleic acid-binding protein